MSCLAVVKSISVCPPPLKVSKNRQIAATVLPKKNEECCKPNRLTEAVLTLSLLLL